MVELKINNTQKYLTIGYFIMAFVLFVSEIIKFQPLIFIFKPLLIPALITLYFFSSKEKNLIYLFALLFAFISNVLFFGTTPESLFYGLLAFVIFRFLIIVAIYRVINHNNFLPLTIATIPFLFVFLYLLSMTEDSLGSSFYPALINALLISFLGGISLSNYILNDNKKSSLLLISTLMCVTQNFLFIIQKFYFSNAIFQPISIIIFVASHYTFYKFLILNEESKNKIVTK